MFLPGPSRRRAPRLRAPLRTFATAAALLPSGGVRMTGGWSVRPALLGDAAGLRDAPRSAERGRRAEGVVANLRGTLPHPAETGMGRGRGAAFPRCRGGGRDALLRDRSLACPQPAQPGRRAGGSRARAVREPCASTFLSALSTEMWPRSPVANLRRRAASRMVPRGHCAPFSSEAATPCVQPE